MKIMHSLNHILQDKAMLIFVAFLYLQPIMDMMIGIMANYYHSSFPIAFIIKILFLLFAIYYICFIRKKNIKYFLLLFIYCLGFLGTNMIVKGRTHLFFELEVLIKSIYLPICLIFVLCLFEEKKFAIKHLYIILLIYMILVFVPNIFHLGFQSYSHSKLGTVGLFYSANAIGSILSLLCPIMIALFINKQYKKTFFIFLIVYLYILFTMGTKAPIICFIFMIFYYGILLFLYLVRRKKKNYLMILILIFILITIALFKILPKTDFYQNLLIHLKFLKVKSFADLWNFKNIDHFIFSSRLSFLRDSVYQFIRSAWFQKIFGIGYMVSGTQLKTSEMDFFVTIIHQGILGFILIYWMYFQILYKILKQYFLNIKQYFHHIEISSMILSILISVLCAFFVGHVLETPSVCIFVVTVMGITYTTIYSKKS